jgi:hypothetical protein
MSTDALNKTSHIVFIVTCLALVGLAGVRVLNDRSADERTSPTADRRQVIATGAQLAAMEGVSYGRSPATLAMVVQSTCPYCAASMPFYRRLSEARESRRFQLVAASAEAIATTRRYLASNGVQVDAVAALSTGKIPTTGTPTLILVSKDGKVLNSWLGQLTGTQEGEVLSAIDKAVAGG